LIDKTIRPPWQIELSEALTRPEELIKLLHLPEDLLPAAHAAARLFPLRVPRSYLSRIVPGNPDDPLLRQILPLDCELVDHAGFSTDPVGDLASQRQPGLLHKYQGRALLVVTGACAVHCRYCFRRHFPYGESHALASHWPDVLAHLSADTSIKEVILSGGDPLSLSDDKLAALVADLEGIPHLRRLRLHTRQPIVLPSRIDNRLLSWLTSCRLQRVVVVHANHARELSLEVAQALRMLAESGVQLLNQSVLLKGVNDTVTALEDLSERLFAVGVLPYYLHQLDRVQGAAHFEVERGRAVELLAELAARLPGYLLPRLVEEVAGAPAKVPLAWEIMPAN